MKNITSDSNENDRIASPESVPVHFEPQMTSHFETKRRNKIGEVNMYQHTAS